MIAAWMLYAAAVAALAAFAAAALASAARGLGRPTRHAWTAALGFSVAWPFVAIMYSNAGSAHPTRLAPVLIIAGRGLAAANERLPWGGTWVSIILLGLWSAASFLLLARLALRLRELRDRRARWRTRLVDGVSVLVAPDVGPAVIGVRRPTIVLPEWSLVLAPELLALVLQHEAEHVRKRDTLPRLLGALATALVPWNPVLWWQADRLSLAIEQDCDARVLRATVRREQYGLLLLAIAQRQSAAALAAALTERASHLERRITAMNRPTPRRPVLVAGVLCAAAMVAIAAACDAPAPNVSIGRPERVIVSTPKAPTRIAENQPMFEFQAEKPARLLPGQKQPHYPDAVRAAKIKGQVLAQFVVNADGTVDMDTFKVLQSTDQAFADAVREALPSYRWAAAEVGGRKVRQLVQEPFEFSPGR